MENLFELLNPMGDGAELKRRYDGLTSDELVKRMLAVAEDNEDIEAIHTMSNVADPIIRRAQLVTAVFMYRQMTGRWV